jgi:GNAT superfamily N-acetyltransferase
MWPRSAGEADLAAVRDLLVETWHATFDEILGRDLVLTITDRWHSIEALRANLRKPYSEFVVADRGDGSIDAVAYASQDAEDRAILHQLYVRQGAQVQGLGTMLLAEVEMAFPGIKTMSLDVIERNASAVRFFEHKRYVVAGRHANWGGIQSAEPVITMEKPLESWSLHT